MVNSFPSESRGRRRRPWVFWVANVLMSNWRGSEGLGGHVTDIVVCGGWVGVIAVAVGGGCSVLSVSMESFK